MNCPLVLLMAALTVCPSSFAAEQLLAAQREDRTRLESEHLEGVPLVLLPQARLPLRPRIEEEPPLPAPLVPRSGHRPRIVESRGIVGKRPARLHRIGFARYPPPPA